MPGTHLCGHSAGAHLSGCGARNTGRLPGQRYEIFRSMRPVRQNSERSLRQNGVHPPGKTAKVLSGKTACIRPGKPAKVRNIHPPRKTAYTRPGKTAAGPEGKMRVRDLRAVFRRIGRTYRPAGICGGTGPPGPTLPMPPDPGPHSSLQSRGQTVGRRTPSCRKNAPGRYGPTNRRYFLRFFKKMRRSVRYCEKITYLCASQRKQF